MTKYFISCITDEKKLGAIQLEATNEAELIIKSEEICPERAYFQAYEINEWEEDLPINEFINSEQMKKLGYI